MKIRACAPALVLSLFAPALLTEAGLTALPFSEPMSFAQSADPVTEVARQRYEDGVKAYDAGRFEEARIAFLQVYKLKGHPAVLLNLGQSELRSNHPEDAGNHLQRFLREHTTATPDQRAAAEKSIAEAKRRTAFIVVVADASGADISVDGTLVGKAPLLDPVFVKPGKHTLFATYQDKSATTQVDAKIGVATTATLTLGTPGAPAAAVPATPPPSPATPAQATPPPSAYPPSAPPPAIGTTQPATGADARGAPPAASASGSGGFSLSTSGTLGSMQPDQPAGNREPFLSWYARKPLAWAGTGVAGVGLIMGIVGSAAAANASANADDIGRAIENHARTHPLQGREDPCGPRDVSGADAPGFEKACGALREEFDSYDGALPWAITGWVLFGVGVVGTATYAMVDWYPAKQQTALDGPRITSIAPTLSPDQVALGIAGTF